VLALECLAAHLWLITTEKEENKKAATAMAGPTEDSETIPSMPSRGPIVPAWNTVRGTPEKLLLAAEQPSRGRVKNAAAKLDVAATMQRIL